MIRLQCLTLLVVPLFVPVFNQINQSVSFLKNIYIFKHFIVNVTFIFLPVLKQASRQLQKG